MADERRDDKSPAPERGKGGSERGDREGGREEGRRHFGRRRSFHGRGGGQGGRRQGGPGDQNKPEEKREATTCPLCGKPVYDLATALCANKDGCEPAHFDCVLERVQAAESISPQERLVYLGSGNFGVIEFKDKSESAFVVKRKIPWETEGEKKDWRKSLSSRITNL
ncbi:MAG TPA: hypothetical protein VMV90_08585 [Rectinemataceae bacterium]|nr:hypothetical protein [Rectinemataceae bacterium]